MIESVRLVCYFCAESLIIYDKRSENKVSNLCSNCGAGISLTIVSGPVWAEGPRTKLEEYQDRYTRMVGKEPKKIEAITKTPHDINLVGKAKISGIDGKLLQMLHDKEFIELVSSPKVRGADIARHAGVSQVTAGKWRKKLLLLGVIPSG